MRVSVGAVGEAAGGSAAGGAAACGGPPRAMRTATGSATAKVATKLMSRRRMGWWRRARSGRGQGAPPARCVLLARPRGVAGDRCVRRLGPLELRIEADVRRRQVG